MIREMMMIRKKTVGPLTVANVGLLRFLSHDHGSALISNNRF